MAKADEVVLLQITVDNDAAIKDIEEQTKEINKLKKANKELADQGKKNTSQYAKNRAEITKLNAARRQNIKLVSSEKGSLNQLRANLAKLTSQRNDLNASTREGAREFRRLTKEINKQNTAIKKAEQAGGDFRRNVGNYPQLLGQVNPSLGMLSTKMGLVGAAIAGVGLVIRQSFNIFRGFESSLSKVEAVTGATAEEMDILRESAIRLGEASKFTVREVANLQVELGKLGFSVTEINEMSKAIIDLATAADTDLATAAKVTGQTLRQFNLDAEETQRVADVMATAFASSALDIGKFEQAMAKTAPIANQLGISLEETASLTAVLANAGVEASTIGVSLRDIYSDLTKQGINFDEALQDIANSQNRVGRANELFGKTSLTVSTLLADNVEKSQELYESFLDVEGAAAKMADTMSNNLQGDLDRLSSSWEGLLARGTALNRFFRLSVIYIQYMVDSLKGLSAAFDTKAWSESFRLAGIQFEIDMQKIQVSLKEVSIQFQEAWRSSKDFLGFDTSSIDASIKSTREEIKKLNEDIATNSEILKTGRLNFDLEFGGSAETNLQENLDRLNREEKDIKIQKEVEDVLEKAKEQQEKELDLTIETEEAKTEIKEKESEKRIKISQKEAKKEIATRQQISDAYLGLASTVAGGISSILKEGSKEQKGFAIFEATLNTARAVTNALAYGVPPLNKINAVAAGVFGAAQIASIKSSSPSSSSPVSTPNASTSQPQADTSAIDNQVAQQEALIEATENIGLSISVSEINSVQQNVQASEETAKI